ncbi:MAG TPA: tetratricopeptide repeat protein [Verrucomicrobiae bacterium]|nr:tetratricopeptide repeat protein [Verrucomicrobiae bacterium]
MALLLLSLQTGLSQETVESRAFRAAVESFEMKAYERAEREFRQFVETFPQSALLPEAVLLQARSALNQTNLAGGIALLKTSATKAGPLADQYQYRLANAYLQSSNYLAAAQSFLFITRELTNSPLLLEASHGEALAHSKIHNYRKVIELLQDPKGAFQLASRARPTDVFTFRGHLLLAEALFGVKEYRAAEEAARRLPEESLTPEYRWDRQYLICRIQVADGRLTEALGETTNLVHLATATSNRNLLADSRSVQADILQQLHRLPEAVQAYTNNLAPSVPADRRRLALLNIIELKLALDAVSDADEMLQTFLQSQPEDAASDIILLTSGEVQLKMHLRQPAEGAGNETSAASGPNHLQAALVQFEKLLTTFTNSPVRGKALLDKGWCLWLDHRGGESALAFRAATELLPFGDDLAVARFKLADALFDQGDYPGALRLYRTITNDFAGLQTVRDSLFDQAIYEMVRASIQANDPETASTTIAQMLDWAPASEVSQRAMWLAGRDRLRVRQPQQARQIFTDFLKRFPDRPLVPEVELAVARTYQLENDWKQALRMYEEWLDRYAASHLRARAEYARALATDKAFGPTNAFPLFTNFVAQFATNELARNAQFWVGMEFFRQGNFPEALRQFQIIPENTNWVVFDPRLTYQARLMAGRSANAAQLWKDAAGDKGHFTLLLNDRSCPDDIVAEALFAYGDTTIQQDGDPTRPLAKYVVARTTFAKIPQLYPTNRLVPLAWGRIGDCSLQLASQDPKQYETATNAYREVIKPTSSADIATRSVAEFGIARALQSQTIGRPAAESAASLKVALDHYLNIFLGKNARDGEEPDPNWVEHAGLAAARLAEDLKQWPIAISIYERLQKLFPPIRVRLQDKIDRLQAQEPTLDTPSRTE